MVEYSRVKLQETGGSRDKGTDENTESYPQYECYHTDNRKFHDKGGIKLPKTSASGAQDCYFGSASTQKDTGCKDCQKNREHDGW
jgi:hypothetical protein